MLHQPKSDSTELTLPAHDAYDYLGATSPRGLIILGDHAGVDVPDQYAGLGLDASQFERHIAYDIGVREVVSHLAKQTGAPAICGTHSRLLIDLNRGAEDPTLIMQLSDGAVVPGNLKLDPEEKARRIANYYQPYHDAVTLIIDHEIATGRRPVLLSIHSFTPSWRGQARPWHGSVLWDRDDRLVCPLLDGLRGEAGLVIGDNVPYSGELEGDTLNRHGTRRGIAHALVEIRQDLISDSEGAREWGARLARIVDNILDDDHFKERSKQRCEEE